MGRRVRSLCLVAPRRPCFVFGVEGVVNNRFDVFQLLRAPVRLLQQIGGHYLLRLAHVTEGLVQHLNFTSIWNFLRFALRLHVSQSLFLYGLLPPA